MAVWPREAQPSTELIEGGTGLTLVYTVPTGALVAVESVVAEIDTQGGSGSFPRLTVRDNSGVVIAEKRQTNFIDVGNVDTATWALRLADDPPPADDPFQPISSVFVKRNANQSIPNNVLTAIAFDTVRYENLDWFDSGVDATLLTVPETAYYVVQGFVRWTLAAAAGQRRSAYIDLNGSLEAGLDVPSLNGLLTDQTLSLSRQLTVGDTLRLQVLQQSGGNFNAVVPYLTATKVWKV